MAAKTGFLLQLTASNKQIWSSLVARIESQGNWVRTEISNSKAIKGMVVKGYDMDCGLKSSLNVAGNPLFLHNIHIYIYIYHLSRICVYIYILPLLGSQSFWYPPVT